MNALSGDVTIDTAFAGMDHDNNGIISFPEFLKW
jgi:hypothetical protein